MKALLSLCPAKAEDMKFGVIDTPEPGRGEVRVRIQACGINYPDVLVVEDKYQFKPERPFAPGGEVAGIIDKTGDDVTGLAVGDHVIACVGWGGLAEYVVAEQNVVFRIPDTMEMTEAAALLMTYGTSHYALKDRAKLAEGETLLVLGAAGGVGLAAVELGNMMGAKVIAAVSSEEKAAVARAHGAAEAIIYPSSDMDKSEARRLTERIKEAACGPVDVVCDIVGGTYSEPALRAIAWEGRFLVVGFPAGIAAIPLNLPLLKGCSIIGVFWGEFFGRCPDQNRDNVQELLNLFREGRLKPLVSNIFPFARGGHAIAHLGSRKAIGKIVVTIP